MKKRAVLIIPRTQANIRLASTFFPRPSIKNLCKIDLMELVFDGNDDLERFQRIYDSDKNARCTSINDKIILRLVELTNTKILNWDTFIAEDQQIIGESNFNELKIHVNVGFLNGFGCQESDRLYVTFTCNNKVIYTLNAQDVSFSTYEEIFNTLRDYNDSHWQEAANVIWERLSTE